MITKRRLLLMPTPPRRTLHSLNHARLRMFSTWQERRKLSLVPALQLLLHFRLSPHHQHPLLRRTPPPVSCFVVLCLNVLRPLEQLPPSQLWRAGLSLMGMTASAAAAIVVVVACEIEALRVPPDEKMMAVVVAAGILFCARLQRQCLQRPLLVLEGSDHEMRVMAPLVQSPWAVICAENE